MDTYNCVLSLSILYYRTAVHAWQRKHLVRNERVVDLEFAQNTVHLYLVTDLLISDYLFLSLLVEVSLIEVEPQTTKNRL